MNQHPEAILILLRIKGFAKPPLVAESLGLTEPAADRVLAELTATGLVSETKMGLRLTDAGKQAADAASTAEREAADAEVVAACYDRFDPINARFKALIQAWQVREVDGEAVPNDHQDPAYDAARVKDLAAIHDDIGPVLADAAGQIARLGRYTDRLAAAFDRVQAGDTRFMAAPIIDSYHTVWFELHEDLIRLTGRTRAEEASAGRAV